MSAQDPSTPPTPAASSGAPGAAPTPPEHRAWWQRGWGVALIALVAAAIGASAGVAGAGGGGGEHTTTATTVTMSVAGPTQTVRVAQAPKHALVRTVTQTVTVSALHETKRSVTAASAYSGNGTKKIGAIILPHESVLRWNASGGHFTLQNAPEAVDHLSLSESGKSGQAVIEEGTFPNLEVVASGEWSFTLTPH